MLLPLPRLACSTMCSPLNTLTPQFRGSGNSDAATSALEIALTTTPKSWIPERRFDRRLKAERFPDPRPNRARLCLFTTIFERIHRFLCFISQQRSPLKIDERVFALS